MKPPVIISGVSGSGKTHLSLLVSSRLGYSSVNIGDALRNELIRHGISAESREEIGPLFLDVLGLQEYLRVVEGLVSERVVLDGMRIAAGLPVIKRTYPGALHIHKLRRPGPIIQGSEDYASDAALLCRLADVRMEWTQHAEELEQRVDEELRAVGWLL